MDLKSQNSQISEDEANCRLRKSMPENRFRCTIPLSIKEHENLTKGQAEFLGNLRNYSTYLEKFSEDDNFHCLLCLEDSMNTTYSAHTKYQDQDIFVSTGDTEQVLKTTKVKKYKIQVR